MPVSVCSTNIISFQFFNLIIAFCDIIGLSKHMLVSFVALSKHYFYLNVEKKTNPFFTKSFSVFLDSLVHPTI